MAWDSIDANFSERDKNQQLARLLRQMRSKAMQTGGLLQRLSTSGTGTAETVFRSDEIPEGSALQVQVCAEGLSADGVARCSVMWQVSLRRPAGGPLVADGSEQLVTPLASGAQVVGFTVNTENTFCVKVNDAGVPMNWLAWVAIRKTFGGAG